MCNLRTYKKYKRLFLQLRRMSSARHTVASLRFDAVLAITAPYGAGDFVPSARILQVPDFRHDSAPAALRKSQRSVFLAYWGSYQPNKPARGSAFGYIRRASLAAFARRHRR
jgi:hypothetical protein